MVLFFLCVVFLVAAAAGWYWWWKRQVVADLDEGAKIEFERLSRADPELVAGMSEERFSALYHKTEMPRLPGYYLAIFATFMLGTPIFFAILTAGDWAMNTYGLIPQSGDVVRRFLLEPDGSARMINDVPPEALFYYIEDLGGFYYFFGLLVFWIGIVWFFMHRYHKRTPGLLRDEIIRERF